jgi:GT2 family glycosyltransferase
MLISFIVISYNTKTYTLACLRSLVQVQNQLAAGQSEIWVVDNASKDGSREAIANQFPQVKLICNDRNSGFGAANNLAMRHAKGNIIALVNSDAEYQSGLLVELLHEFEKKPKLALIGPKVVYPSGKIQTSNNAFPTVWTEFLRITHIAKWISSPTLRTWLARWIAPFAGKSIREYLRVYKQADEARMVDWVAASIVFFPSWLVEKGLFFDERFVMYYEDTDWCKRIRLAGWEIGYSPAMTFSHWADERPGKETYNQFTDFERQKSKLLYFQRYSGKFGYWVLRIVLLLQAILQWIVAHPVQKASYSRIIRLMVAPPT